MAEAAKQGTPWSWRLGLWLIVAILAILANRFSPTLGYRGQAILGFFALLLLAASFSSNLRAVKAKTIIWGLILQFLLGVLVIYVEPVQNFFKVVGQGITKLIDYSDEGAYFVFGKLSVAGEKIIDGQKVTNPLGFVFAFKALPPIIFISAFFSLLYYLGILQFIVRIMARVMMYLMGTSGAETLSVAANVFMGQTEAPLIVKPFVPKMTQSELLAMMASGMATISGGLMAFYMSMGADPVAILCTSVMACPCSLYLTKLVMPELEQPLTMGNARIEVEKTHVNAIDAISSGVKDGLFLALNVAAMLIAFIAFIALIDGLLSSIKPILLAMKVSPESLTTWPDTLRLQDILGFLFSPVAILLGVNPEESTKVGTLLGIKLAANENVAYLTLTTGAEFKDLSSRSKILAVYALTGFANFASVGIQLGGIGALAPERRSDLARLGMKALFVGFMATMINACVAGMLLKD